MVAFSAWCSVSVFVATQVDCLLYRYTESNQYANFTCVPSRLLRSYDGSRSREHILTTRAAALATEFYTFLQIQIAHVSELRRLANKGLLKLDDVKSGFSDVNTLVYRQHEITKGRKKKLEDRKTETRSYWDELFGREVGITPKLREDLIDLIIEIETLQELTFTCLDAEQAFHHALEILQDLDNLLLRMGKRMAQTQGIYKEQRSVDINRWPDLVELTRSLLPIVDAFQKTGKYYKDSRLHAANDWKAKLDQCVRTGGRDCGHGYQATSLPASQTAM
ncbi:hypothetical protein DL98DRAFT_520611 [Cadophora sp. DSE1049]|nr:hypothetical protein DL98DRAFT_520611 [Cadophora sp. DSE1049]